MQTFKRAVYIVNGNMDNDQIERELAQTLPKLATAIKQFEIMQTKDLEELVSYSQQSAAHIDLMIIHGGDGTIHQVINAIASLPKRPTIAIIPGGTCNDFSRMLGLPQNLGKATDAIVRGNTTAIDIGQYGDRYFLNFWGVGLIADASNNIDENQKARLGVLSYFISTLKTVNQAEPFAYELEIDGERLTGEAVMLLVMNGRFIGTREFAGSDIRPDDGKLHVFVVKNSNLTSFKELLQIKQEKTDLSELNEVAMLEAEKIRFLSPNGKPIDMDGEVYRETPGEVKVLPAHLDMIIGE
ncbi:lipid kinase, YegS/Rv2252/BmrU family [Terribacillus halophilus]|uniref:Lipid kinase, YegS/Rv2252/BmrU family n=1 Tax=Terribacillus halophilus TaxID=361279 RepID=A0A1G6RYI0_9BACI|nr:YegS/Rv2252/BmrU family lipid kinase [Terribacillus halophilus]SDD09007.1 lipid kinase, YegS/Rv2252/BmrU family [Terribacillus halophilus]